MTGARPSNNHITGAISRDEVPVIGVPTRCPRDAVSAQPHPPSELSGPRDRVDDVRKINVDELASHIREGSRGHIARAITLVESTNPEHRQLAHQLLRTIAPDTGKAFRVGISGVPGAG